MLMPGEALSASYHAVPEAVPTAREVLTEFAREAGVHGEQLQAVRLAASEAISNVVMHAYDESEAGEVQVNASFVGDELWVLVADSGHGLRARENSPGLGLGLALIAQLVDDFEILSRGSGGTELRMRFDLSVARRRRRPHRGSECGTSDFACGGSTPVDGQLIGP